LPNLASVFKAEIARIARREVKTQVEPLKKQLAASRAEVTSLKRRLSDLEKGAKAKRTERSAESAAADTFQPKADENRFRFRFRASGLASNRKRLGLSAEQFGKLVGATGQSVYAWEAGKTVPRGKSLAAIASIRGIGKKEVAKRLAELDQ
jgi:DNA-binding transcriptional regulator YiaG